MIGIRGTWLRLMLGVWVALLAVGCSGDRNSGDAKEAVAAAAAATAAVVKAEVSPVQVPVGKVTVLSEVPHVEKVMFRSEALNQEMPMNIYVPPGYDASNEAQTYPVLYMLHGYAGNENSWFPNFGMAQKAEELIKSGSIKPMIIVSPLIENSFGVNSGAETRKACESCMNEGRYQDYIVKDVIGYVEAHYRVKADKANRYIGGLSMGGWAAMYTAFSHPEMFSKAGGHSPALWTDGWDPSAEGLKAWLYPTEAVWKERDPIALLGSDKFTGAGLEVYLDCGSDDAFKFYEGAQVLHRKLQEKGVHSEFHLNGGGHNEQYWTAHAAEYLEFYGGQ